MPSFQLPTGNTTPFGRNEFLRSTSDVKTESYTFAASTMPVEKIDGFDQKILQPGTVIAKITSGPEINKVGVFDASATDGRQTPANIVGICLTFLPWQLMEHDEAVSVVYEASIVKAWCFYYANGVRKPASDLDWAATVGASTVSRFLLH